MMINWLAMYFYEGNNMDKVFVSPNRYVQGKDLLTRADAYIKPFRITFYS